MHDQSYFDITREVSIQAFLQHTKRRALTEAFVKALGKKNGEKNCHCVQVFCLQNRSLLSSSWAVGRWLRGAIELFAISTAPPCLHLRMNVRLVTGPLAALRALPWSILHYRAISLSPCLPFVSLPPITIPSVVPCVLILLYLEGPQLSTWNIMSC